MRKRSIQRIGGIGAIGGASCSVAYVFLITFHSVSAGYTEGPSTSLILADYALALAGLFGLAVVPALSRRVLHVSPGVVYWLSIIAQVGFGLLAVMSFWQAEYETNLSIETSRIPVVPYEEACLLCTRWPFRRSRPERHGAGSNRQAWESGYSSYRVSPARTVFFRRCSLRLACRQEHQRCWFLSAPRFSWSRSSFSA